MTSPNEKNRAGTVKALKESDGVRKQTFPSEAFDTSSPLEAYGAKLGGESSANNCLPARRLAERDVRFIQLFRLGWDHHGTSPDADCKDGIRKRCSGLHKPITALLEDLRLHGSLADTLAVWVGEFGRTPMKENRAGNQNAGAGRDHHKEAFTQWIAGGGVKSGFSYGSTDPIRDGVVEGPVSVHDFHAKVLYLLDFDQRRLTYPFQGFYQRLSNVAKRARDMKELIG